MFKNNSLIPITELSNEELIKLFNNNNDLQKIVEDNYIDCEISFLNETLQDFDGLVDYEVGFYTLNYIDIDLSTISIGIERVQEMYGFFNEKDYNRLTEIMYLDDIDENSKYLEEELQLVEEEIKDIIYNEICNRTTIKKEYLIDYFIEWYVSELGDYYVDRDRDDYNIFAITVSVLK